MTAMRTRIAGGLIVVAAVAAALVPVPPAWVDEHYARGWFPAAQRTLTTISNAVPFALIDPLILAAAGAVLAGAASVLRAPRGRRMAMLIRRAGQCAVAASLTYLVFLATWGANYRRPPVTALLDFDDGRVTNAAVVALNETAIGELVRLRPGLPQGATGWGTRGPLLRSCFRRSTRERLSCGCRVRSVRAGPNGRCSISTSLGRA